MSLMSRVEFECPDCHATRQVELVLSINRERDVKVHEQLLEGELNSVACACGKRTHLAATLLYSDEVAGFWCQVCVGGEEAEREAEAHFRQVGPTGTQRVVPSRNALVEKVKIFDAGLQDWAIELTKVLLLVASKDVDLNRVLLFDGLDRQAGTLQWVSFEEGGQARSVASSLAAYERGLSQWQHLAPGPQAYRIDRLWARDALERLVGPSAPRA